MVVLGMDSAVKGGGFLILKIIWWRELGVGGEREMRTIIPILAP